MASSSRKERTVDGQNRISKQQDFPLVVLTPEQRLTLRSVPFFRLPDYETLPDLSMVRSKVNTQNPSYKRPKSAPPRKATNQKTDYSHVVSKVDTGRVGVASGGVGTGGGGGREEEEGGVARAAASGRKKLHQKSYSSPEVIVSKGRSVSVSGPSGVRSGRARSAGKFRSYSTTEAPLIGRPLSGRSRLSRSQSASAKLPSSAAKPSQDFTHIRSRVGSLGNIHYQPGGGNIKIEAPSKLEVKATPKVKVWENINYTSGGRKISYPSHKVGHFKQEARSRVDTRDPNPAHRMQRSLQELTITEGSKFNPRFNPNLESNTLRRHRMATMPGSQAYTKLGFHRARAATIHSFPGLNETGRGSPEFKQAGSIMLQEKSPVRSKEHPADLRERVFGNSALRLQDRSSQSSEESSPDDTVEPVIPDPKPQLNQDAVSQSKESPAGNDIIDMQVENSGSETTVYLFHLLNKGNNGQRNGNGWGQMPRIEEDESEDSEENSEDSDTEEPQEELEEVIGPEPSKLCHPIPQLVIYDEEDDVVETVNSQSSLPQIEVFDFDSSPSGAPKNAWSDDAKSGLKSYAVVPSIKVADSTDQTIPIVGCLEFAAVTTPQ